MGVKDLWKLLESAGRPVSLEELQGLVLAVDVSLWLHQAVRGVRDKQGQPVPGAHLSLLFSRICKLLHFHIKPVFVFDGGTPVLKQQTLTLRSQHRQTAAKKSQKAEEKKVTKYLQAKILEQLTGNKSSSSASIAAPPSGSDQNDMFALPPLAEDVSNKEKSPVCETVDQSYHQEVASLDVHSSSFSSLPPELQHELLQERQEMERRTYTDPTVLPSAADDFSNYQLSKLLGRSRLSRQLESVRQTLRTNETVVVGLGAESQACDVESRRIVSSDSAHYILVRGVNAESFSQEEEDEEGRKRGGEGEEVEGKERREGRVEVEDEEEEEVVEGGGFIIEDSDENSCSLKEPTKEALSPVMEAPSLVTMATAVGTGSNVVYHSISDGESSSADDKEEEEEEREGVIEQSLELGPSGMELRPADSPSISVDCGVVCSDVTQQLQAPGMESRQANDTGMGSGQHISTVLESGQLDTGTDMESGPLPIDMESRPLPTDMESGPLPIDMESGHPKSSQDYSPTESPWTEALLDAHLEEAQHQLREEVEGLERERARQERRAAGMSSSVYREAQELISLFGMPYIISPMEAEAQCAYLDHTHQTSGTVTDDSDVFLFGGQKVYRNFFNSDKDMTSYSAEDIKALLGLGRDQLVTLAYLLGSDYTEGLEGVGVVNAVEFIGHFRGEGMEPLRKFKDWYNSVSSAPGLTLTSPLERKLRQAELPAGFPNEGVWSAYHSPEVDESTETFQWGRPDLDRIRKYMNSHVGWEQGKVDDNLLPVLKNMYDREQQKPITSFLLPSASTPSSAVIRSARLRNAVTRLRKRKREEEDEEEEVGEMSSSSEEDFKTENNVITRGRARGGRGRPKRGGRGREGGGKRGRGRGARMTKEKPDFVAPTKPVAAALSASSSSSDSDEFDRVVKGLSNKDLSHMTST